MAVAKKSWREKLEDSKDLPRVSPIKGKKSRKWGEGTVVIPAPKEVDELMKKVPRGRLTTIGEIREALARRHGATIGCPLTTGIFAWVAAWAAEEDGEGGREITPWWRTLKSGGELNEKYPGGVEKQAKLLQAEGHVLEEGRGKKPPKVREFEKYLMEL